ncbi:MAG: hypothetical protein QOI66_1821 [Myxococcales bacterium]|jgi:hypothetical protein|nr:hypothetical protein [Myxococcales bacterium]
MIHLRSLAAVLLLSGAAGCSSSPDTSGAGGNGGDNTGSGGRATKGSGGATGIGGASSGFDAYFPFTLNDGTGGTTAAGTGGTPAPVDARPVDGNAPEKPARTCLAALGDAPGGYDWSTCCPNEAATAQDWCTHYTAFCKYNFPLSSNLSPGAVPLKDMADCLARFPPLTLKSRACRSNFLCEDSSLGQATDKACDFPDLNRRKCDGL